jgi:hypothetical protein
MPAEHYRAQGTPEDIVKKAVRRPREEVRQEEHHGEWEERWPLMAITTDAEAKNAPTSGRLFVTGEDFAVTAEAAVPLTFFYCLSILNISTPTLRRTSALVTEWSQNCGHLDKLSCHLGPPARETS